MRPFMGITARTKATGSYSKNNGIHMKQGIIKIIFKILKVNTGFCVQEGTMEKGQ